MRLIEGKMPINELKQLAEQGFGNFIKAVVDIEKNILIVDAELHADQEAFLLEKGSRQKDLWGINLYPGNKKDELIEFDSMINLKPSLGNRTRGIENQEIRDIISKIVFDKIIL